MGAKREPKAREATPDEILTALTLEARRRGLKSYGGLQTQINWVDQQEIVNTYIALIVNTYIALKDAKKKEKELRRSGCDDNENIRNLAGAKVKKAIPAAEVARQNVRRPLRIASLCAIYRTV